MNKILHFFRIVLLFFTDSSDWYSVHLTKVLNFFINKFSRIHVVDSAMVIR